MPHQAKFLILLTALLLPLGLVQAETYMVLHKTGGESVSYAIAEVEKIVFENLSVKDWERLEPVLKRFRLQGNYPNPFNPTTTIRYELAQPGAVELRIFDVQGRELATLVNQPQSPGAYQVFWNGETSSGSKASAGTYFYSLRLNGSEETRSLLLLK